MKFGHWLLLGLFLSNIICVLLIGGQSEKIAELESSLQDACSDNERLVEQLNAFYKLKSIAVGTGSEPVHLQGSMWVVFDEGR